MSTEVVGVATQPDVPSPAPASPTSEEVLHQLHKLTASRQLRESQQLHAFLDFIVHETLAGQQAGLKEYLLGCKVFGRRPDYDPRHDGIVRVQATALRKKLTRYYVEDGADDRVVIDLPRGGYVPGFRYADPKVPVAAPVALPVAVASKSGRPVVIAFCFGVAATLLLMLGWSGFRRPAKPYSLSAAAGTDCPQIWSAFFAPGAKTLVAYGVPLFFQGGGLYIRDVQVNTPGIEADRRIQDFGRIFHVTPVPSDDTYTGVGEAQGTNLVANFLTSQGVPVRIANARALGRSDIARENLVVVSSLRFQTLLGDLRLPADFRFLPVSPEIIENDRPLPGESRRYIFAGGAGVSTSYALISVWPGISPERRILYIAGVHTWATQAATEFLFDRKQLQALERRFQDDVRIGAHGKPSPAFQILLRVEGRQNHSQEVEYLTHHYLPATAPRVTGTP